ncbi:oxygen-independent coproporphyrinogen III oxidase [Rhodobaculum claviforme]|uniref:Coproporphyrinogen-III oxidase n=1 Tax=Rhodobaculum claviforme TaxID=1549854 RepID=A0A934WJH8_9RHOB|nr:oxygen-independent coproporphyrinogen III oxidase [Rhodobaculum claviforme]MBK5927869.1 oxygen-independent coproporphyrinogen III oxidase [Rhodobaculum claviforme]
MTIDSQLTRLGLFDARVPRYTSYPTAPHFSQDVQAPQFLEWVRAIPEGAQISLYLHVPFCRRLCWFCACRTQGTSTDAPVAAYVETLKAELDLLGQNLPAGVRLSRLHWGGGTPTLLSPDLMRDLAAKVREVVDFGPDAEFSVEIDPNEVDEARLDALAEAGMNRASIGVQDFDPEIQETIGRDQSYEITQSVVEALRARGIRSLNADILYGLPHQTSQRLASTVQKLLSLGPDRVALYGYAHVPWMARRQQMIPSESLPTPEERLKLYETARRLFVWDGYDEIGIDHFARPDDGLAVALKAGELRRNFQGYTDDTAPVLVGLGASSISYFPQGYAQNVSATSAYTRAVREGQFPTHRGHAFVGEDLLRRRMIEALMCDFRIDTAEMIETFGVTPARMAELYAPAKERFGDFVRVTEDSLSIPPEGRPLTRMIAAMFDAYGMSKAGHSSAV